MRSFLLVLLLAMGGFHSHAAEAPKYAILSLIGDGTLISQGMPATGGRLDQNAREFVPIVEGVFDKAALLAANGALKELDPASKPVLLFARERSLYETGATHLLLITKVRSEARIPMANRATGSGMLEVVGFYLDASMHTSSSTGASGTGIMAPFAYFKVEVIDVGPWEIVKEARVTAARPMGTYNASGAHIWNTLTLDQKVRTLQRLVTRETRRVVLALAGGTQ